MLTDLARRILRRAGFDVMRIDDIDPEFLSVYEKCRSFTMTSFMRMYALYEATRYIVRAGVPGAFVECGVWKGGSAMLAAYTLRSLGAEDRELYLYDTYAGMAAPSAVDVDPANRPALEEWKKHQEPDRNAWCYASLDEVRRNLRSTGYPEAKMHFVEGLVEETIPARVPERISILRLDTDWYESTRHELQHLYPLLSGGGVLILDDYQYWQGAKKATDEYLRGARDTLLWRVDSSARIGVKRSTSP